MRSVAILGLAVGLAGYSSCSSSPKAKGSVSSPAAEAKPEKKPNRAKPKDSDNDNAFGLQSIHFPAVSLVVETSEREKLVKNAAILKANPKIMVEIEGHTDGRGKMDQSLELGEARAKVVKEVLAGLGIAKARMSTISYGKDRRLDHSGTEEGYAKNRRVNFLVLRY